MYEYQPVPFRPLAYLRSKGKFRNFTLTWLLLCTLIVPSAVVTRLLELTGIPLSLFGVDFHVTLYIPLIICIPLCLCFGFTWAAIPVYLATMLVALIGGMPLQWTLLFSFANPIGLAIMVMIYRITPARLDLKSLPSLMFFVVVSFLSSLSGSIGSFIWTYTNQVNLHDFFKVWQGWWLGGFLQSVIVCAPILYLFSSPLLRIRDRLIQVHAGPRGNRRSIKAATIVVVSVIVLYVWLAFQISIRNIKDKLELVEHDAIRSEIVKAAEVTNFPVVVFIFIVLFLGYFFFYFIDYWTLRLQSLNEELHQTNSQLLAQNDRMQHEATHDSLTGVRNRAYFFGQMAVSFKSAKNQTVPFTVFMLDLDKFKTINDTHGHQGGDVVLKRFAQAISELMEPGMTLARLGGEEFCVLAPGMSGNESFRFAKKVVETTRRLEILHSGNRIPVTVSVGFREVDADDSDVDMVLEMADRALYQAKNNGRDQYCSADPARVQVR